MCFYLLLLYILIPKSYTRQKNSTNEINDNNSFSLVQFILHSIRYGWAMILITMNEFFRTRNKYPAYVRSYREIVKFAKKLCHENERNTIILISGILLGPLLIEIIATSLFAITYFIIWLIWKLISVLIQYCWLIIVILISENLTENEYTQEYIQKYKLIKHKTLAWCQNDSLKKGIVIFLVLTGPFLLKLRSQ